PRRREARDRGAVDLVHRDQARAAERLRDARPVLGDRVARVVGAEAAIQRGVDAVADAADAREEAVADFWERGEARRWRERRGAHGSNPGSVMALPDSPSTLKSCPIWVGSTRRWSAARIAAATSAGLPRVSASARAVMPSRVSSWPWVIGPWTCA